MAEAFRIRVLGATVVAGLAHVLPPLTPGPVVSTCTLLDLVSDAGRKISLQSS